jgi:hypothetical protein
MDYGRFFNAEQSGGSPSRAAGCGKTIFAGLLKKISEAYEGNGVLEYGNIGILGFKRIHPSFHPSTTPIFITLERGD